MRTKICRDCGSEFHLYQEVDGDRKDLRSRSVCLDCLPYNASKPLKTKICMYCGCVFPRSIITDDGHRNLDKRLYCLECSPYNGGNSNRLFHDTLSDIQKEILNGHLLGDGNLTNPLNERHNSSFRICRSTEDMDYLTWTALAFPDYATRKGLKVRSGSRKDGTPYEFADLNMRRSSVFSEYRNKWYPSGKKVVPTDLILTPLTIAVWLADDRSVRLRYKSAINIVFSTLDFSHENVLFLADSLTSLYGKGVSVYTVRKSEHSGNLQYSICLTNTTISQKLIRDIDPVMPLLRKAKIWRGLINEPDM